MHIETAELRRAFDSVRHVADSSTALTALAGGQVRLHTPEGGRLVLTARDDHLEATDALPCDGEALDVCLPASRIASVLVTAGDAISIEHTGPKALVKSGRSRHTIACLPGEKMASIALEGEPRTRISAPDMGKIIASVIWAAAKGRLDIPALNGIHLCADAEHVTATATDAGMLATHCCDVKAQSGPEQSFDAVISLVAAQRIVALTPEHVEVRAGTLRFLAANNRALTVRTLAFTYPDWKKLFPQAEGGIKVNREEFLSAVTAAASYDEIKGKDKSMRAVMLKSDGARLVVYSPGRNEGCRYEIETIGCQVEASYRANCLVRALNEVEADEIELLFATRDGHTYLRINDGEWRFLLAPYTI